MAKYTIELRNLIEKSNIDIGLKNYPLYVFKNINQDNSQFGKDLKGNSITNYRDYLNNKIIKHFYFREIGFETPQRFVFMLNRKMEEIMIYYNQMFETTDKQYDPFWDVDLTETFTHEVTDTGESNAITTGNETITGNTTENGTNERTEDLEQNSINSIDNTSTKTPNISNESITAEMDTPQPHLTNDQIKEHQYLSKATHNLETTTGTETTLNNTDENLKTTNDNTITSTEDKEVNINQTNNNTNDTTVTNSNNRVETYTRKQEGSSAGYMFSQNINQWRSTIINIDMLIIDELEELFMQIF